MRTRASWETSLEALVTTVLPGNLVIHVLSAPGAVCRCHCPRTQGLSTYGPVLRGCWEDFLGAAAFEGEGGSEGAGVGPGGTGRVF